MLHQGHSEGNTGYWWRVSQRQVDPVWKRGWEVGDRCDQEPACVAHTDQQNGPTQTGSHCAPVEINYWKENLLHLVSLIYSWKSLINIYFIINCIIRACTFRYESITSVLCRVLHNWPRITNQISFASILIIVFICELVFWMKIPFRLVNETFYITYLSVSNNSFFHQVIYIHGMKT